jgi:PAS domain S-box-containing protein
MLLDADGRHLRYGAGPNLPDALRRAIDGMETGPAAGACGTAVYDRQLVVVEDFQTDPRGVDYRELSARLKLRACWSQPVFSATGQVLGTFAMYYSEPRSPTPAEQRLIAETGNLVTVAIESARNRDALVESEQRFRAAFEQAAVGIAHVAPDGRFLRINQKFCDIVGYNRDEMLSGTFQNITHPDDLDADLGHIARLLAGEIPTYSMEKRYRRKDSSLVWVNLTVALVRKDSGAADYFISVVEDITERRHVERALQASEARIRRIFEQASDAIFVISTDNRFLDVNPRGLEMTGYTRAEFLRLGLADIIVPDERPRLNVEPVETMAGKPHLAEWLHRRKDGSTFPAEVSARQLSDDTYLAIVRDLTERRRAEDDLKKSEALYHDLVETSQDLIWRCDAEGRFVYLNQAWEQVLGYKADEMLGKRFSDFQTPEMAARDLQEFARLMQGNTVKGFETVHLSKSGIETHLVFNAKFLADENGKIIGTRGTAYDITERRLTETALRASEGTYRSLFENMLNGFAYCQMLFEQGEPRDFICLSVNKAFETLTGLKDAVGRKISEVIPGIKEADPELFEIYGRVALTGKPERFEIFLKSLQAWFWLSVYSPNKEHFVAVFDVITERKQAEQALHENTRQLEILSRRLLAAQETERRQVARELHDEIGQLLTVVKLDLQTVLRESGTKTLAPSLKEGMESIDRVVARVRDLSLDLRPSMLDDLGLVPTLRWYVQRQTKRLGAGTEVALTVPPSLPRLGGEIETACFRVAQEALTNTARHAGANRIEVTLKAGEHGIELTVHDNGHGFDIAAARGRMLAGAGIGLLGMQERAELAGGQLTIGSAPGRGTTVRAWFPAKKVPEPTA